MDQIQTKENPIDISVIIPVYNPPMKSFQKMMESMLGQTVSNYEILLVDDGSNAKTKAGLEEIASKYSNIRIISQDNHGVSYARNTGIAAARGKYIAFVDADDYVDKDFLKEAYGEIETHNADVLYGQICIANSWDISKKPIEGKTIVVARDGIALAKRTLLGYPSKEMPYNISGSPCGNLYRTDLCQKIGFNTSVKYFEDQLFNREILNEAMAVAVSPKTWYYYLNNVDSAMHHVSVDEKLYEHIEALLDDIYELNTKEKGEIENAAKNYMIHLWWGILTLAYRKTGFDKRGTTKIMKKVSNHPLYHQILTQNDITPINTKDRLMMLCTKSVPVTLLINLLQLFKKI